MPIEMKLGRDLDRAVLIEMLGLQEDTLEPLELLRDKWCSEPTVRGRKKMTPKRI